MTDTPAMRTLRARAAAYTKWAHTDDRQAATAPARAAARNRFEKLVDPDGTLPETERIRRADMARKAFYASMAYKSAAARRARSTKAHRGA